MKLFTETSLKACRICRSLAATEASPSPRGTFFLSSDNLATRIGKRPMEGYRILQLFVQLEIILVLKKGTRRAANRRGVATTYAWGLSDLIQDIAGGTSPP